MKRGIKVMAALLVLLVALPMTAQRPAGTTSYRVSLLLYPGDDSGALATQVATIYRGKLEGGVDAAGTFTIALSESMVSMMTRDPHVRSVKKLALEAAVTSDATATGAIGTNAVTEWKLGDYEYDGSGNIKQIGDDVFVYDSRSRLIRGDAGAGHKQEYTYDGFGNVRTIITDAPGPIATNQTSQYKTSVAVNPKTNRAEFPGTETGNPNQTDPLTGQAYSMAAQYDATGNVIALQINDNDTFQYDGLGRLVKAKIDGAWRAYVYTASDERIGTIGLSSENGVETGSSWTIRDTEGKVLRRYAKSGSSWTWNEDYIYRGSQMLAAELPGSRTKHFHLDHLGTPRLVTDGEGVEISRHTYYPFGYEAGAATSGEKQFTGHERDSPTLDYMHARYFAPSMGRFLSVDPAGYDLSRPQTFNRYSYVTNNPINRIDPDGRREIELLWNRLKHIINKHINKDLKRDASKFAANNPKEAQKLIEKTVKPQNLVATQDDGRKVYEKTFNKTVGTRGETTVRAVTEPAGKSSEKVITGFPTLDSIVKGVASLLTPLGIDLIKTGAEVGAEKAGELQDHLNNNSNIGRNKKEADLRELEEN